MVSFKLCVSDPSTGKTFQKEVKDSMARPLIGLNIGETVKGDNLELAGYELQITGGSDYCGFPMRRGILGLRKKIVILGGIGFRGAEKGIKKRKTVCGHKIHEQISQINLKVLKPGPKKLNEIFGVPEKKEGGEKAAAKPAAEDAGAKPEVKEEKKEHKKPEADAKEAAHEKKETKEPKAQEKKEEHKESKEHKKEENKE